MFEEEFAMSFDVERGPFSLNIHSYFSWLKIH